MYSPSRNHLLINEGCFFLFFFVFGMCNHIWKWSTPINWCSGRWLKNSDCAQMSMEMFNKELGSGDACEAHFWILMVWTSPGAKRPKRGSGRCWFRFVFPAPRGQMLPCSSVARFSAPWVPTASLTDTSPALFARGLGRQGRDHDCHRVGTSLKHREDPGTWGLPSVFTLG